MTNRRPLQKTAFWPDMDTAGTTASLVCAVHCALMPLVITLLPLIGLGFLATEGVEWTLISVSALLGISSLCLGFRRHRRKPALMVLAVGLALLAGGRVVEEKGAERLGVPLVVVGGCSIASAHFLNRRFCQACRRCYTTSEASNKQPEE